MITHDENIVIGLGLEVPFNTYISALRQAWAVYGALVAAGSLPAYNFDGSEKVQLAKWGLMHSAIAAITETLAMQGDEWTNNNFEVWERENKPKLWTEDRIGGRAVVEDEDFDESPKGDDEIVRWILAALKANKLPYKLVHVDPETQALVDALQELVDEANAPAPESVPEAGEKAKKRKKSK